MGDTLKEQQTYPSSSEESLIETQGDSSTLKPKHEKLLGSKKKITKTTKPKDQAELDQETQDSKGKDDEPPPPPFAGLKLKPKRPVQRKPIEEPKKDTPFKVELKHHEFEKPPQTEEVEMECSILLGNAIVDKKVKLAKKEKYKKKVPKKAEDLSS